MIFNNITNITSNKHNKNMKNHPIKFLSLFAAIVAFCFMGCVGGDGNGSGGTQTQGGSSSNNKTYKDQVICHQLSDPTGLNPTNTSDGGASTVKRVLFQHLLDYGSDLKLKPVLAEKIPTVEKTPDGGMIFEYVIREGATWDDGKPITGEDVAFTFKAAINPKVNAASIRPSLGFLSDIKTYKDNPRKVTFIAKELDFMWDHVTGTDVVIAPKHIYDPKGLSDKFTFAQIAKGDKKAIDSPDNRAFAEEYNNIKYQREIVVGSGPYKLKEWNTDQNIIVERKDNWWGDKILGTNMYFAKGPKIIKYQTVNDQNSAITALKGEELDALHAIRARDWLEDIKKSDKIAENFNLIDPPLLYYSHIGLNTRMPKLRDKRVRQALAHLVDVDLINETLVYGMATRVIGPIHPSAKEDYNNSIKHYDFSVEKAKALLKEAGWEDTDGNGIVDKVIDGKRTDLKLSFNYNQGNDIRKNIGLTMKEAARQAGVELEVIPMEWSVFSEKLKANKIPMWYGGWVFDPRPHDPKQLWHTSSYGGGSNYTGFGNAETDKLIEQIRGELDPVKRSALYKKWQEILHDETAYIFMFTGNNRMAVHNRFDQGSVNASGRNPGYHPLSFQIAKGFSGTIN